MRDLGWINGRNVQIEPDLSRVALMFNPDTAPHYGAYLQSFKALPQRNSVEIEAVHVRSVTEIEMAVAKLGHEPLGGLIAAADVFIVGAREAILKSADQAVGWRRDAHRHITGSV
jgi:putative ABC transport system substrate-binding protein